MIKKKYRYVFSAFAGIGAFLINLSIGQLIKNLTKMGAWPPEQGTSYWLLLLFALEVSFVIYGVFRLSRIKESNQTAFALVLLMFAMISIKSLWVVLDIFLG